MSSAIGAGIGAAGSIAGGLLAQESNSSADEVIVGGDPRNNPGLQGAQFDALNQIGFGDISSIPGPFAQLVDKINALPINNKTKRRGLHSLRQAFAGEKVTLPTYLKSVLTRVGVQMEDLDGLIQRDQDFKSRQAELSDLNGINDQTIRNRADASAAASSLISDAARASTGGELSDLQNSFLTRINRSIDDSEERTLLQGSLGGFNPAAGLEGIADLRQDAELRAIEQSLLAASNITGALNGGLQGAFNSGQSTAFAQQGALGLAANQANAANALRARIESNNKTSLANGVSGAFSELQGGVISSDILGGLLGNDSGGGGGGGGAAAGAGLAASSGLGGGSLSSILALV